MKHKLFTPVLLCLAAAILTAGCFAAEDPAEYCFAETDFSSAGAALDGIFLMQVPDDGQTAIYLGSRQLRCGDVIPSHLLGQLRLISSAEESSDAEVVFCAVEDGHVTEEASLLIPVGKRKNRAPTAENSTFETYKNIANTGTLSASDPEGEALTYTMVREPKRGTVVFHEDGTFTYTPAKNKVGKDSFIYTATDPSGAVSAEATVSVQILKPAENATYSDLTDGSEQFLAIWLREKDLFSGETVAGYLCFSPERQITRGEFLAMTMELLDAHTETSALSTGFADENDTPVWMQPYLVSALKTGMITGVASDDGMIFRPTAALTRAEAAVMLQNALNLPISGEQAVFAGSSTVPAWAQSSWNALACAGITLDAGGSAEPVTRLEAARVLYQVSTLLNTSETVFLPWAK